MSLSTWTSHDPRALQRRRWLQIAKAEAEAAASFEPHITEAFRMDVSRVMLMLAWPSLSEPGRTIADREERVER